MSRTTGVRRLLVRVGGSDSTKLNRDHVGDLLPGSLAKQRRRGLMWGLVRNGIAGAEALKGEALEDCVLGVGQQLKQLVLAVAN